MRVDAAFRCLCLLVAVGLPAAAIGDAHGDLATRLSGGSRSEADKARDAGRKPAEVVAFLGIEPGMTVVDLIAAGGWYTEVLAEAVGPKGKVYAHNTAFTLGFRDGANDKAMKARLEGGRLPNVERLDRELGDLGLEPGSVDAAITALNFHDVYNGGSPEAAEAFLVEVKEILEPGGVLGIIDHVGVAGQDNEKLHRIEPGKVEAAARAVGFEVDARSDLLRNPEDDHTKGVFDPSIRGRTDRFLLRLRKPAAG
jgi:predicted methyltransferase